MFGNASNKYSLLTGRSQFTGGISMPAGTLKSADSGQERIPDRAEMEKVLGRVYKTVVCVMPVKTGIQSLQGVDSRFARE